MPAKVIAIGMDGGDPTLVERWMDAGLLPGLAALRRDGAWGRLSGGGAHRSEQEWTIVLSGCEPENTGHWTSHVLDPSGYRIEARHTYDYADHPPFYALGDRARVAVVDLPQMIPSPDVNGIQIVAWGAHAPQHPSCSSPPELFDEMVSAHGPHPTLNRDAATFWNPIAIRRLRRGLGVGIGRRVEMCRDLLAREPWDLFLTAFGEPHSAGHFLWHLDGETLHPLGRRAGDAVLEVFQAVDAAIARVVDAAGDDASVVVFSPHGMESNSKDLPSVVFLPELLYRLSFPGRVGLAPGREGPLPSVMRRPRALSWERWMWRNRHIDGRMRRILNTVSPQRLGHSATEDLIPPRALGSLSYHVSAWYSRAWPRMRAFALPSFSDGFLRVNVAGREAAGIVPPERFTEVCDEMEGHLRDLRDPRTGRAIVREVIRVRSDPFETGPELRDADLIAVWESGTWDVVDSPAVGRIGPVPFGRTGSHVNEGWVAVKGPGATPGSRLPDGEAVDVTATILDLLGEAPPQAIDGRSLLRAAARP